MGDSYLYLIGTTLDFDGGLKTGVVLVLITRMPRRPVVVGRPLTCR